MTFITQTKELCGVFVDWITGPSKLHVINNPRAPVESLVGYHYQGYVINIHCLEKNFLRHYHRWFIPNKRITTYEVFATTSADAPKVLKDMCYNRMQQFPKLLNCWMPDASQSQAAVQAYLDLLITRLSDSRHR
jgi:hypothetical protein